MRRINDADLPRFIDILNNSKPLKTNYYLGLPTISSNYKLSIPVSYEFEVNGEVVVITNNNESLTYSKEVAERLEK